MSQLGSIASLVSQFSQKSVSIQCLLKKVRVLFGCPHLLASRGILFLLAKLE